MPKDRAPDQTAVSISLPKDLLTSIDERAAKLGLNRSRYLGLIAQQDLHNPGDKSFDIPKEAYEFLLLAIPALARYEKDRDKEVHGIIPREPLVPPEGLDPILWSFFILERDEILKHKWIESQKAGHDIGINQAILDWVQKHRSLWAQAQNKSKLIAQRKKSSEI